MDDDFHLSIGTILCVSGGDNWLLMDGREIIKNDYPELWKILNDSICKDREKVMLPDGRPEEWYIKAK